MVAYDHIIEETVFIVLALIGKIKKIMFIVELKRLNEDTGIPSKVAR